MILGLVICTAVAAFLGYMFNDYLKIERRNRQMKQLTDAVVEKQQNALRNDRRHFTVDIEGYDDDVVDRILGLYQLHGYKLTANGSEVTVTH